MAQGKQTMEWACKFTSFTITQGPAGSLLQQGNYEGTVSGEVAGTILGTVTFVGGKSGTFSLCVAAYLDDGNELSSTVSGTYESTGKHHWATQGAGQLSDGHPFDLTGEIDLANRTWTGKNFEHI